MMQAMLTPGWAAAALFGAFFLLLVLRVPVAFALGLACLPILAYEPRLSPMMLFNETFKSYNSFILLAVPLFLLTANLMSVGGITDRLVVLSRTLVGSMPGALAQINVVLSVFFAGISGSSTADSASQSKIFIDAQTRDIVQDVYLRKVERKDGHLAYERRLSRCPTRPNRAPASARPTQSANTAMTATRATCCLHSSSAPWCISPLTRTKPG